MMQLCGAVAATEVERTTTLRPIEEHPGRFPVELDPGRSGLVGVHRGYLCALAESFHTRLTAPR